jgi:phosphatidylserine/phosphatidylglycerophosphate/cardiolipin synthase-like enzyme
MERVRVRAYAAPAVILLAMDWSEGNLRKDFLGFAVKRTPGFRDPSTRELAPSSWLLNRINFDGPAGPNQPDYSSDEAPIQKFMWWDARIGDEDREAAQRGHAPLFRYEIWPVVGQASHLDLLDEAKSDVSVVLPAQIENSIGTWFNRAVLSSQAFSRKLGAMGLSREDLPSDAQQRELRRWLANGLENVVPDFLKQSDTVIGAIYHLTDRLFIIPALDDFSQRHHLSLVYDAKLSSDHGGEKHSPNDPAVQELGDTADFHPRDKASIMHNKFLVSGSGMATSRPKPIRLVTGSANYTTGGLSTQADLMHTFDSPDLAALYFERFRILKDNPSLSDLKPRSGWSRPLTVGDAGVRVFFSPEPDDSRDSIDTIVDAIHKAKSSVLFCLFTPTDEALRDACFMTGDNGKMMFGLVNHVRRPKSEPGSTTKVRADQLAALELYHRSRNNRDVIGAGRFVGEGTPEGFDDELLLFPGEKPPPYPPVIIHHKFIIIDAETDQPVIFSGSANMSKNSLYKNDENLLEIRGSRRLAYIYFAEFFRLYEHYRARAVLRPGRNSGVTRHRIRLARDSRWAEKYYRPETPEYRARRTMAREWH